MRMKKLLGSIVSAGALALIVAAFSAQAATADQWEVVRCNADGSYDCKPGCTIEMCCDSQF